MIAYVKMQIFSGRRNPEWVLNEIDTRKLGNRVDDLRVMAAEASAPKPRLGYRGLTVTLLTGNRAPQQIQIYNHRVVDPMVEYVRLDLNRDLERFVYRTAPIQVVAGLAGMSFPQLIAQGNEVPIAGLNPPDTNKQGCANGPSPMNSKAWVANADLNNCYNYANDVLNTDQWSEPAMPGGMTTVPAVITEAALKTKLNKAVIADGLTLCAGDKVPSQCPGASRHYMAVFIRHHPSSTLVKDFHCLRLDTDGSWSHKDGTQVPRNTDDGANAIITDLTAAKFDGQPTLVGVYRAKRPNARIK